MSDLLIDTQREKVHEIVSALYDTQEEVRATNHARFRSIYLDVFASFNSSEPFDIRIRRAFNRFNKIARDDDHPIYLAGSIAVHIASELDPTYEWHEKV